MLVMTPVAELYAIPAPPLSEVLDILLLNVDQSAEVKRPRFAAEALGRLKVIV